MYTVETLVREVTEMSLIAAPIQIPVQVLSGFSVPQALKNHYIRILVRQEILMAEVMVPSLIFVIIMFSKKGNWTISLILTWKTYI